jgi:DNA gyrase/topoisomerase IV subunit A
MKKNIENIKKIFFYKNIIIIILLMVIFFFFLLFYFMNEKNIQIQKYLHSIYENGKKIKENFPTIINKNYSIENQNHFIILNNFLDPKYFDFLKKQFDTKTFESSNFIYRKASGLNFTKLHEENDYLGFIELYYSNELLNVISDVLKKPIQRPPLSDNNSCSLLIYSNEGDHINWHMDHSIYNGNRYVLLLTIVNENKDKTNLSQNEFQYIHEGKKYKTKMKENSLVIFKGSEILHKSTSIGKDERRILLSIVLCDICQENKNIFNVLYEKGKNMVLYGSQ